MHLRSATRWAIEKSTNASEPSLVRDRDMARWKRLIGEAQRFVEGVLREEPT
jgi:hypothetical protein